MSNDRAAELFAALRASTSEMLGLSTPTPIQQLKVDLAASCRLEIDRIVSQQLAGHPADVKSLTALTESLRSLFPAAADSGYDFSGARAELEAFLTARAEKIAHREKTESERLRSKVDSLTEENARLKADSRLIPTPLGDARHQQPPPPAPANVVPIKDAELKRLASRTIEPRSAEREAELASNAKAFRDSYSTGGGAICAPPFNVDPRK
jgi:hypothetical protein